MSGRTGAKRDALEHSHPTHQPGQHPPYLPVTTFSQRAATARAIRRSSLISMEDTAMRPLSDQSYAWVCASTIIRTAQMCSGVVPQQPPMIATPPATSSFAFSAMNSAVSGYTGRPALTSGRPA